METDNDNSIGKEYEENKNNNINVEVVQGLIQQTNGENRNDAYEKYEDNGTINSDPLETSDCVRMSVVEVVQEVIPPTNGENQNHAHEEYDNNGTISSGPLETFDVVQSLVYMSNSIGGQEEVITEFSDGFKEKLKTICVSVLKENIEHEESKKIKSLKIAKKLAVFLIEATTRPLYTVVSSERLNNSEEDIPSHFLKASPLLLLAFNQMTDLYKNSSVLRYDAPLKTFAGYVCTALCQIDNTLQSLDNFTFKKVHLADKMKDENVIYSLDSIPAKPLVLDYDDFTNDFDTKSIITVRVFIFCISDNNHNSLLK